MEFVNLVVAVVCLQQVVVVSSADYDAPGPTLRRTKRSLVYPEPSTLLLIFGLGTPLQLDRESVIVGAFAKMIYNLPTNSTLLTTTTTAAARNGKARSRWSLYRSLGQLAQSYGFGEGRACVLRSICEAAVAPFERRLGLLHHLLQTVLSPSSSRDEYDEHQDREYHEAEVLGRGLADCHACHALYPDCRFSPLDAFSTAASRIFF